MNTTELLIIEAAPNVSNKLDKLIDLLSVPVNTTTTCFSSSKQYLQTNTPDLILIELSKNQETKALDLCKFIESNFSIPTVYFIQCIENQESSEIDYLDTHYRPIPNLELLSLLGKNADEIDQHFNKSILAENMIMKIDDGLFIKRDHQYEKVKTKDILYIKSDGNYLELVCPSGKKHIIRSTLKSFLGKIPSGSFFRTHKSYVVNIAHLDIVSHTYVRVQEEEIPLAKNRKEMLMDMLCKFS